jgi:hypothetical protein
MRSELVATSNRNGWRDHLVAETRLNYRAILQSWPLAISKLVCMALAAWILVLKFRFGTAGKDT